MCIYVPFALETSIQKSEQERKQNPSTINIMKNYVLTNALVRAIIITDYEYV